MILYGIPNCNTVKKAQTWLKDNQIDFEFHDFKKKGITEEKLHVWIQKFGVEKVLNKKGLTFKKLTAEEQKAINSIETTIQYLKANTSAIKRPIVENAGMPQLIGFEEESYRQLVLQK